MDQKKAAGLAAENMKTIFAYSLSRVSGREDAEDLAGDIIAAIIESAPRLRDEAAFFGYIWAIAANTSKKFLRGKYGAATAELDENIPSEEDVAGSVAAGEELCALRRELALLSRQHRECTVAYYIDGLSCRETSEKLDLSPEMVKYYLFKTRKILKEGIAMEREFGEKSYNPGKFEFITVFSGSYNAEYRNLFNRKLTGNILLSAYYTPMTVRELSIELGVASPYLEDELGLLERYGLIRQMTGGKYQTDLIIFTEGFDEEFRRRAVPLCVERLGAVYRIFREKLPQIRAVGFAGSGLDDNRLGWALTYMLMWQGHLEYISGLDGGADAPDEIYSGATGVNYGSDYDMHSGKYGCAALAGYAGIAEGYGAAFADFGVLEEKNRFARWKETLQTLRGALDNPGESELVIFSEPQQNAVLRILAPAFRETAGLYAKLAETAAEVMRSHAPKHVWDQVERIIRHTLFFYTAGLFGACAVDGGSLDLPDFDGPAAVYLQEAAARER